MTPHSKSALFCRSRAGDCPRPSRDQAPCIHRRRGHRRCGPMLTRSLASGTAAAWEGAFVRLAHPPSSLSVGLRASPAEPCSCRHHRTTPVQSSQNMAATLLPSTSVLAARRASRRGPMLRGCACAVEGLGHEARGAQGEPSVREPYPCPMHGSQRSVVTTLRLGASHLHILLRVLSLRAQDTAGVGMQQVRSCHCSKDCCCRPSLTSC